MKINKNNKTLLLLALVFFFVFNVSDKVAAESGIASNLNTPLLDSNPLPGSNTGGLYTVDYPTLQPKNVFLGTPQPISTMGELKTKMAQVGVGSFYLAPNMQELDLNEVITVNGDKELDLSGKTINAGEKGAFTLGKKSSYYFKLKNGHILGGRGGGTSGSKTSTKEVGFVFAPLDNVDSQLIFEDITQENVSDGGFVKAVSSDMFFYGNVNLKNGYFNIRGGSVAFYGKFYGEVAKLSGNPGADNGGGAVNVSFPGYGDNARTDNHTQFYGDRRVYVGKSADVELKSNAIASSSYSNCLGNFSTLTIDGSFKATSESPPIRTTASNTQNSGGYLKSRSGTYNGMANINVNEGAKFNISSTTTTGSRGAFYTYSSNIFSYKPAIFDMRYFGPGNFFYSYNNKPNSNMYLYDLDVAVWDKESKGVGNPNVGGIWQGVTSLEVTDFTKDKGSGEVTGKPDYLNFNKNTFDIASYSRISNDVLLPQIIPDDSYKLATLQYEVGNGSDKFFGKTDYKYPDGTLAGKAVPGTEITLTHDGSVKARTTTDNTGNWSFNNFKGLRLSAKSPIILNMTDSDKRIADAVTVQLKDTLGPSVTTKLQKIQQNTTNALNDPKLALSSYTDETSSSGEMSVEYVTPLETRQDMLKKVGYHEVKVKVTDLAGNPTTVNAPVIVYEPTKPPTSNGFASGNAFSIDYDAWVNASDDGKRQFMIDEKYGNVKGYEISGDKVTDVTDDPAKTKFDFTGHTWAPKKTYPIKVSVGTFSRTIDVTLVPAAVKMTPKQVYKDTETAVFEDLSQNITVDNSKQYDVKIGDPLNQVITKLIADGNLNLKRNGYNEVKESQYKVKVGNEFIDTDKVPDKPFELIFEYIGQMKFDQAPNLDFGKITISKDKTQSELSPNSQDQVKIINTLLKYDWTLKASIPKGITKNGSDEEFLGQLLYYDESGSKHVIGKDGTNLTSQKTSDKSLSTVNVRGQNESGMRLEQHIGNNRAKYSGDLVWSLEDVPKL